MTRTALAVSHHSWGYRCEGRPDRRRPGRDRYSRILGKKLEQAEGEPVAGGTDPSPVTSPDVAKVQRQLKVCQWLIPGLTGAIEVLSALHGEQQRPWTRRPRYRVGAAIAGPRPTTQRVCAARRSALSQVRNAVSAPLRPQRAQMPPACSTTASR